MKEQVTRIKAGRRRCHNTFADGHRCTRPATWRLVWRRWEGWQTLYCCGHCSSMRHYLEARRDLGPMLAVARQLKKGVRHG